MEHRKTTWAKKVPPHQINLIGQIIDFAFICAFAF